MPLKRIPPHFCILKWVSKQVSEDLYNAGAEHELGREYKEVAGMKKVGWKVRFWWCPKVVRIRMVSGNEFCLVGADVRKAGSREKSNDAEQKVI